PVATTAHAASGETQAVCGRLSEIATALAKEMPIKLDDFTTQTAIEADCATKTFSFAKKANGTSADFPDGWQKLLQEQWGYLMCGKIAFSEAIETGWEVSETISFADGTKHRSVAVCK
ncbi:MAG: hypothetical protein OEM91_14705, partial [Hyphomicrobiales bacterium]|nr:hypothetical protein [Hyphomicrobiales bacterium]